MEWLFRPKVLLGLLANLVFVVFTCLNSTQGAHVLYRAHDGYLPPPAPAELPYIPVPPPSGPPKANSYHAGGELSVFLDGDIDLVRRPGLLLQLSPIFSVPDSGGAPSSVMLRFTSYSNAQYFAYDKTLAINADGAQVWPAYGPRAGDVSWQGWNEDRVERSVAFGKDGVVVETVGKDIPFEVFAQLVAARQAAVRLGPIETSLTAEQLSALRSMQRRISGQEQPPAPDEPKLMKAH